MSKNPVSKKLTYANSVKSWSVLEIIKNFINGKDIDYEESLNLLIYGFEVNKLDEKGNTRNYTFFISHSDNKIIEFVKNGGKTLGKIDLSKITEVDFGIMRGGFSKLSPKNRQKFVNDLSLSIFVNSESFDLIFNNTKELNQFCAGIYHIWKRELDENNSIGIKNANIKQIWNKYDNDHSGKLEIAEFEEFLKEIRFNIGKNFDVQDLFRRVDQDNSGKIDFNEFVNYFQELTSAKEFSKDFNRYANEEGKMDINGLINFLLEIQNQICTEQEAMTLILTYNKNSNENRPTNESIDEKISNMNEIDKHMFKLDINQFQNFMIDSVNNNAMNFLEQSLDHPTNDYFIYSSHNTYLKGHQLYGESSVEMYAYAISLGCRCVELDCWDGKNNEPKITHGMTFTSDILFKDVLKIIKENAFKNNQSPFFLSIEMHCGDEQQKIMASYIKTILIDTWIPEDNGIPNSYPSPNELRGKFIIKCKRPKVIRSEIQLNENKEEAPKGKYKIKLKDRLQSRRSIIRNSTDNYDDKISVKNKNNDTDKKKLVLRISSNSNVSNHNEEEAKEEKKKDIKEKKKTIKEVVPDLYTFIGLISVGFNLDDIKKSNHYQPWDVVSLSESKIMKYFESDRDKLIDFTCNSFLRIYPKGTRIDSSNYDPVKSWILGAQLVSLNLQSLEDDYTLLNHIFFKINNETGYVLKPTYLRNRKHELKDYSNPAFKLNLSVLSGIMLQKCMKQVSSAIYVTVKVIGTYEDDNNPVLKTDSIEHNFLHPLFKENEANFSIYESELSFILIKMFDNKGNVLARSVIPMMCFSEGYRTVTLYDNHCQEIENSILIIFSKKI